MKKVNRIDLENEGFRNLYQFVDEQILSNQSMDYERNGYLKLKHIQQYFEASQFFHQPGGDGYNLVLQCLQRYLDFKFLRENNIFRFDEGLFGQRVSIVAENDSDEYSYIVHRDSFDEGRALDGTRADIYYLLNEADQNGIASRRCINYINSNKLHLTAVLVQLIERTVENLENDKSSKYNNYAKVLRAAYMTPEYAGYDVNSIFEVLGYSKKQYYRLRNNAISFLSEALFGLLAGESGFTELYIRHNQIKICNS